MRTLLLVPTAGRAHLAQSLETGLHVGADALVIDLATGSTGSGALIAACDWLRQAIGRAGRPALYARIPPLDDENAIFVLSQVIAAGAEGVVLPNALGGNDVTRLDARISVEEAVCGGLHGSIRIIAEVASTARSAQMLNSLRGASHRLVGLAWNAGRLAADLGGISARTPTGTLRSPLDWARAQVLIAAAAAGVTAILDDAASPDDINRAGQYEAARDDGFSAILTSDAAGIADIGAIMTTPRQ